MQRFMSVLGLVGMFLIMAGCGVTSTAAGGQATTPTNTPVGSQATTPPAQGVTIHLDSATYHGADGVKVTVTNGLATPIYAHDTAASCSILTLQQQVNGAWQSSASASCPIKRTAMIVKIAAGGTYTATITASYPGTSATRFPAGTYQLVLPYTTSPDALPTDTGAHLVASTPFTVAG